MHRYLSGVPESNFRLYNTIQNPKSYISLEDWLNFLQLLKISGNYIVGSHTSDLSTVIKRKDSSKSYKIFIHENCLEVICIKDVQDVRVSINKLEDLFEMILNQNWTKFGF